MSDEELIAGLDERWYPVLVKPSAGGGGKGMRVARSPGELPDALAAARREALTAFGDDALLVERYVASPRHIEIQVLADAHGTVLHLGERECSLQRRHQKIIEEAPSPLLDTERRDAMGRAAVQTARSVGYTGAGTVEFIVDGGHPDDFFFMEMNTRLQVEHPVTELVYGLDLVEWQLRVAAGERLTARGERHGHAVEARVYAEDPDRGFLPTGGTVLALREPAGQHVRVDSGLAPGAEVTSAYDPMLAKIAAWGPDRGTALRRLDAALAATAVLGVTTNIAFLRELLADPDVIAGNLDTGLAERVAANPDRESADAGPGPDEVLAAAALGRVLEREAATVNIGAVDPWDIPDGWRVGEHAWTTFRFASGPGAGGGPATFVRTRGLASEGAEVAVGDGDPVRARAEFTPAGSHGAGQADTDLLVSYGGRTIRFAYATDGATAWLGRDGRAWALTEVEAASGRAGRAGGADATVRSPMPGTVIAVHVTAGQPVSAGQPVLVVEAMKMEHTVTAPRAGIVTELTARTGQQVRMDEPLAVIDPTQERS